MVQIPYGPEFFLGLISTTRSLVFIAARIAYIRFFPAAHIYDFDTFPIIIPLMSYNQNVKHKFIALRMGTPS